MSHTSLPWHEITAPWYEITAPDGRVIATLDANDWTPEEVRAHADLIVRAVNCHEALLAVVNELLSELADKECVGVDEFCADAGIGKRAKTALAKATG